MKLFETERLILEKLEQKHFPDLCSLLANKKVHRFFPKTFDEKGSKVFLQNVHDQYRDNGYSFWAVIRKEDYAFIGICGLLKQHIDNVDEVEVGYRINDKYWGNGYGTEAARGCMQYARDVVKAESVISLILDTNVQSIRVAEKNGLTLEKEAMHAGFMHRVYRKKF